MDTHFLEPVPVPIRNPGYMDTLSFERNFELHKWRTWMSKHWTLSVHVAFAYAILVHLGQNWMKSRRPYRLQFILTVWNIGLAAFSFAGFLRSLPEVRHILATRANGFLSIICSRQDYNAASAFWALVGTWSKTVELGDTAFIVLRKQPLIFLHWYHHATVMLYTWYTYEDQDPCHRFFIVMNYFVHTIMYSYYALRAIGVKIPKNISMVITSLQLVQMIVGCGLNGYSYYIIKKTGGLDCARMEKNVVIATGMYLSYLFLFAHFFYKTYLVRGRSGQRDKQVKDGGNKENGEVSKNGTTNNKVKAN